MLSRVSRYVFVRLRLVRTRRRDVHLRRADLGDDGAPPGFRWEWKAALSAARWTSAFHLPFQTVQLISRFRGPEELQGPEGRAGRQTAA